MAIKISGLCKSYRMDTSETQVLQDFACEIPSGKTVFISGPNGAGKTVLAKCLCGLEQPDHGTIEIDGIAFKSLTVRDASSLGIRYLPQLLPQPPSLFVHEFLLSALKKNGLFFAHSELKRSLRSIKEKLSLDLPISLKDRVGQLNQAQLQYLYLIRALILPPTILILDEPTAHLSLPETLQLARVLNRLAEERITIMVIAHPEQYPIPAQDVLLFSRTGLTSISAPHSVPKIGVRASNNKSSEKPRLALILSDKSEVALVPGAIVQVRGPNTSEFHVLADRMSRLEDHRLRRLTNNPLKIQYVPADAIEVSLAPNLSVMENLLIGQWEAGPWCKFRFFISRQVAKRKLAEKLFKHFNLVPADPDIRVSALSGGNRQRLVIGRATAASCDLLIGVNVFRGLDPNGVDRVKAGLRRLGLAKAIVILLSTRPGPEDDLCQRSFVMVDGTLEARIQ